jgi:peptide/nickel transport system permease protein
MTGMDDVLPIDVPRRRWRDRRAVRALIGTPAVWIGGVLLLFVIAAALLAPWLYPADSAAMVGPALLWPGQNPAFPLGTNSVGNDVLAQLLHGARISLLIGSVAAAISVVVGAGLGAVAGFFGGWVDAVIMRIVVIFQTIPHFVLLVVVVAIASPSIMTVTLSIAFVSWDNIARLTRAEFRSLRERDYVMAARGLSYGSARIIFREILPNALPPLIVSGSMLVGTAILMESAISFMGLGDPRTISWGSMIGEGRQFMRDGWYLTAIPGLACVMTVLAINLIADGLNEALNPRLTERE